MKEESSDATRWTELGDYLYALQRSGKLDIPDQSAEFQALCRIYGKEHLRSAYRNYIEKLRERKKERKANDGNT